MEGTVQQENQGIPEQSQPQQQAEASGLTAATAAASSQQNETLTPAVVDSTAIQDKTEVLAPGQEEETVQISDVKRIVKIAVAPYIERIAQLEEALAQKDCQLTAVFYAMKKMDEIIKKLESEQAKTLPAKNSRISQSSSAIGVANKTKRAPSAVNASSFQTASPLSARSSSTRTNTDFGLSKSSLFNNTEAKAAGGKVLTEEKLKRTAQTLSRSALFEHPNNASFSKTEKIPASRLQSTKTKKETDPKAASTATKATKNSDKTKLNSTKDIKGTTSSAPKENLSNGVSSEATTKQTQPETILNQLDTVQSETTVHPPNELNLLSDLNNENHVLDSASPKDKVTEKSQIVEQSIMDESHQLDDSLLI